MADEAALPQSSNPLPQPPLVPKPLKKRTRTGCLTCRKRKHKCGEEKPQCARCIRAGMECVWPDPPAAPATTASSNATAGPSSSIRKESARPYPHPSKRSSGSQVPVASGSGTSGEHWLPASTSASVYSASNSSTSSPQDHTQTLLPQYSHSSNHQMHHRPHHHHLVNSIEPPVNPESATSALDPAVVLLNNPTFPIISPFSALDHQPNALVGPSRLHDSPSEHQQGDALFTPGGFPSFQNFPSYSPGHWNSILSSAEGDLNLPSTSHLFSQSPRPLPVSNNGHGDSTMLDFQGGWMDLDGSMGADGGASGMSPLAPWLVNTPTAGEAFLQEEHVGQGEGNEGDSQMDLVRSGQLSSRGMIDRLSLNDSEQDSGCEGGRQAQGRGAVVPRYSTPTSSLVLLFPNPEERHLMQHFLYSIPALFVGIPASSTSELTKLATEEHPNLNSFFPFLDIPHFLSLPRGHSSAADALALSLMSVGAGRLSHLYHAESTSASSSPNAEENSKQYGQLSVSLVQASVGLGQTALAFGRLRGGGPRMGDDEITHLLSTCSMCILAKCLSGGRGYEGAFELARGIVDFAGGPKAMLEAVSLSGHATITSTSPPASVSRGTSSALVTPSTSSSTRKKKLRMLRSVLEDLASWDLFASLSTGLPPSSFSSSSPHASGGGGLADWLFAYSPPSGTREGQDEDWETLESTLGFSRILMDLFSRVNVLYASSRSPPPNCSDTQVTMLAVQLLAEIRIRKADVLRSYPDLAQPSSTPAHQTVEDQATEEEYLRRVRYGRLGKDDQGEFGRGKARRLQYGDLVWTLVLEIMVRVEVQGEATNSEDITALASRVVTLVQEAHRRSLVTLGFLWPLIIAGSMFEAEEQRDAVRVALETLRSYCCFDLNSGREILREVWDARDSGDAKATWRDVAPRCGAVVL